MNTIQITNQEGQVVNYTEAEVKDAFTARENLRRQLEALETERLKFRYAVRDFFSELTWTSGYDGGETTIYKEHVNDLLDSINLDKLTTTYRATVTLEVEVSDIEATDEDEVPTAIEDYIDVTFGAGDARVVSVEVTDVEEEG